MCSKKKKKKIKLSYYQVFPSLRETGSECLFVYIAKYIHYAVSQHT